MYLNLILLIMNFYLVNQFDNTILPICHWFQVSTRTTLERVSMKMFEIIDQIVFCTSCLISLSLNLFRLQCLYNSVMNFLIIIEFESINNWFLFIFAHLLTNQKTANNIKYPPTIKEPLAILISLAYSKQAA